MALLFGLNISGSLHKLIFHPSAALHSALFDTASMRFSLSTLSALSVLFGSTCATDSPPLEVRDTPAHLAAFKEAFSAPEVSAYCCKYYVDVSVSC